MTGDMTLTPAELAAPALRLDLGRNCWAYRAKKLARLTNSGFCSYFVRMARLRDHFPLSRMVSLRSLLRVHCVICRRTHNYRPEDLIEIFGDIDVSTLDERMRCERDSEHGRLEITSFLPEGEKAVGLRIRRLVAIKMIRVPVWRED